MTRVRRMKGLAARLTPVLACLLVTALIGTAFVRSVDLTPKVDEAFFFSPKDPELKVDREILAIFPESPQKIIAAGGDIPAPAYGDRVRTLSDALARQPGVKSVQSLSRGPKNLDDALKSPLWTRLLIPPDHQSSYVFVTFSRAPDATVVEEIEAIGRHSDVPAFRVMMSGVPFITTEIGRNLARDLRVFSLAALGVFGLVLLVIFRSSWILLGTFAACADSSATTLLATHWIHIPIGPLTANLSTMVFVMTLSPIVFLTFNWKRVREEQIGGRVLEGRAAMRAAVRRTVAPSFWSSVCMTLGFISLLLVPSTPMRHLGIAGAIGAAMAFVAAYVVYPWFLEQANTAGSARQAASGHTGWLSPFFARRHGGLVAGLVGFSLIGAYGLRYLNTDPALPSYFKKGGAIRMGLDAVDNSGGSSPLKLVVEDRNRAPLDTGDAYKRLWILQDTLERDPAVGTVVSIPVVLGEAKRRWYTIFVSDAHLIKVLDTQKHGEISRQLITTDRTEALFLLRMRETDRTTPRQAVIDRLTHAVERLGFRPVLVGGTYSLLDQQARLDDFEPHIRRAPAHRRVRGHGIRLFAVVQGRLRDAGESRDHSGGPPRCDRVLGMPLDFITASAANLDPGHGRGCDDLSDPGCAARAERSRRSVDGVVTGVFAPLAADRDLAPRALYGVWHLPAVEFSADPTLRSVRDVWICDRRLGSAPHVPVAGERTIQSPAYKSRLICS